MKTNTRLITHGKYQIGASNIIRITDKTQFLRNNKYSRGDKMSEIKLIGR